MVGGAVQQVFHHSEEDFCRLQNGGNLSGSDGGISWFRLKIKKVRKELLLVGFLSCYPNRLG